MFQSDIGIPRGGSAASSAGVDVGEAAAGEGGLLSFDGDEQDWNIVGGNEIDQKSAEELQSDLTQLEDEINTLKQVLTTKVRPELCIRACCSRTVRLGNSAIAK